MPYDMTPNEEECKTERRSRLKSDNLADHSFKKHHFPQKQSSLVLIEQQQKQEVDECLSDLDESI